MSAQMLSRCRMLLSSTDGSGPWVVMALFHARVYLSGRAADSHGHISVGRHENPRGSHRATAVDVGRGACVLRAFRAPNDAPVVFTSGSPRARFLPFVSATGSRSHVLAGRGHGQNAKNRSPPRTLALWPRRRREANPTKKAPRCVHQRGFLVGPGGPVAQTLSTYMTLRTARRFAVTRRILIAS